MDITGYYRNEDLGLTVWSSEEQAYYLIPFANVTSMFKEVSKELEVPVDLVDKTYDFMSTYDPRSEIVLLTLNDDLLTVAIVRKDLKPSREAIAEMLDWSLGLVDSVVYMDSIGKKMKEICKAVDITPEDYDKFLSIAA
jgi:hypothetical protein